jgi:hypothetical protein
VNEGILDALDEALAAAEEADDALRDTVRILAGAPGIAWAGIAFVEDGSLTLGPAAGQPRPNRRTTTPVAYEGAVVGELQVDGDTDPALVERVASLIGAHVLIGWDTGGEAWEP